MTEIEALQQIYDILVHLTNSLDCLVALFVLAVLFKNMGTSSDMLRELITVLRDKTK